MSRTEEKLAVAGKIEPEVNRHYARVAKRYAAAGVICMILFVAYLLGLIVFGSEYITYDNMRYLIRDFGTAAGEGAREFGKIVYNGSADTVFAYFRGGAAVCTPDAYRYFDKNGTQIIADPLNYSDPVLAPSDKYMLVYDVGGTGYSVYNQLTGIVAKETEDRIIAADIADDGSLVLVHRQNYADDGQAVSTGSTGKEGSRGKKVYFAAPLFSQSEKDYNLLLTKVLEDHGYEVFLPQRDGYLAAELAGKTEDELTQLIFEKDFSEVMKADIVFMLLDGRVPDEGACVELGIAYANGKRCYGVKTDARSVEINMDLNPMITGCFIKLFKNFDGDKLVEELEQYLSENEL